MRLLSRAATGLAAVLALATTLATPALAQGSAYPNKPVRVVVSVVLFRSATDEDALNRGEASEKDSNLT